MTEFGYEDDKLNSCRYDESCKLELLKILSDFVAFNYITEWQAGYITGMTKYIKCVYEDYDFPDDIDYEKIYEQLLMFIWSHIHKKEV